MNDLLIIDLEATCWELEQSQPSEIIEIGWCHLVKDKVWKFNSDGSILVQPVYSMVSEFCTELTGHTQKSLMDFGVSLEEAARILREEIVYPKNLRKIVWCSWGMYDYRMLKDSMKDIFPLSHLHLNIKSLFSAIHCCKGKGLAGALDRLDLKFIGRQHNGQDDAINAARVLMKLIQ